MSGTTANASASKNPVKAAFRLGIWKGVMGHLTYPRNSGKFSPTSLGPTCDRNRHGPVRPAHFIFLSLPGRDRKWHLRDRLQGTRPEQWRGCGHKDGLSR